MNNVNNLGTNKRYLYIIFAGIALALIVIIFIFLQSFSPKAASTINQPSRAQSSPSQDQTSNSVQTGQNSPSPITLKTLTPEEVASKFYSWYISYSGPPFTTDAYKTSNYLSPGYKRVIGSFTKVGRKDDPILCNANKKTDFTVLPATPNNDGGANVFIAENTPSRINLYRFKMYKYPQGWLIDDTICQ